MKNTLKIAFLSTLLLVGCATDYEEQQSPALKNDVAMADSALRNGRVDVALPYVHAMTTFVDAPVKPVEVKGLAGYVVLPDIYKGKEVILYDDLLKEKDLVKNLTDYTKQEEAAQKQAADQKKHDDVIRDGILKQNKELLSEIADWKKSWFYTGYEVYHSLWTLWIIIPLIVAGLIALCVFFPPAVPFVIAFGKDVLEMLGTAVGWVLALAMSWFSAIVTKVKGLGTTTTTPVTTPAPAAATTTTTPTTT